MADIFISYKSERRAAAEHLARILELNGFTVWFDYGLMSGKDFSRQIEREIRAARAVVVLWCTRSIQSEWVLEEAHLAKRQEKIVPCFIEKVDPPLGFGLLDTIDLSGWDGSPGSNALFRLWDELHRILARDPVPQVRALRDYENNWRRFGAPTLAEFAIEPVEAEFESRQPPPARRRVEMPVRAPETAKPAEVAQELSATTPIGDTAAPAAGKRAAQNSPPAPVITAIATPDAAPPQQKSWHLPALATFVIIAGLAWYNAFGGGQPPPLPPPFTPDPPVAAPSPPASVSSAASRPASTANAFRIGVAGPMSGPNAAFGKQMREGVEQAVLDINAAGGIQGRKLELTIEDDVSDPKQGIGVAMAFERKDVRVVIGHFNSGVSIPASEVYAENGTLMISPSSTNPRVTERGMWNVFRTAGRDDQQGEVAAAHIASKFRDKRIAIVHDRTTYGQLLADSFRNAIKSYRLNEVLYDSVTVGEKDFSALVAKLRTARADVIYWGGLQTEAGLILRQMRDAGLATVMISGDGIASSDFATIAGRAAEGTLMTFPPDPRRRPEAQRLVAAMRARGVQPESYTLYAYAAVEVVRQAAEAARTTDARRIADQLRLGQTNKTVIGDIVFDKKGDVTRPDYVIHTWRKGADGTTTYFEN